MTTKEIIEKIAEATDCVYEEKLADMGVTKFNSETNKSETFSVPNGMIEASITKAGRKLHSSFAAIAGDEDPYETARERFLYTIGIYYINDKEKK